MLQFKKTGLYLLAILLLSQIVGIEPIMAHALDGVNIESLPTDELVQTYFGLGFTHILPLGLDHILFVLSLFFLEPRLKPVLLQASVFTLAHSITLGIAMYGLVNPPAYIVEPIIALSIVFVAIENIVVGKLHPFRLLIVFGFGLVHGLGFAGVLSELGIPQGSFFTALLSFNIGVEAGQVAVILLAYVLVGYWFRKRDWYKQRIVIPASLVIALIAGYWTLERLFF